MGKLQYRQGCGAPAIAQLVLGQMVAVHALELPCKPALPAVLGKKHCVFIEFQKVSRTDED